MKLSHRIVGQHKPMSTRNRAHALSPVRLLSHTVLVLAEFASGPFGTVADKRRRAPSGTVLRDFCDGVGPLCTCLCLAGAFTNMTPRKTECECGRPLTWRPNNRGGCDYCTALEKAGYDQYIKPRNVTNRFGEPVTVLDAYAFRGNTTGMINML